jgi:ribosome-binding factor A
MGQRIVRVNELVKREISDVLHTRFQTEAVYITITEVEVSPDLRHSRVYYSVLGKVDERQRAERFLSSHAPEIRRQIGKRIILKYLPALEFISDHSIERGTRLNAILDDLVPEDEL